jgi:hypothetical protein
VLLCAIRTLMATIRGLGLAIRGRPGVFAGVALGVLVVDLLLPILVLSLARGPFTHVAINPWLSRLPEWLRSSDAAWSRKLEFVSEMALAWVIANNPPGELEWALVVDVPSLGRLMLTALMLGAYFALWSYGRDRRSPVAWGVWTARYGGAAGAVMTVAGFFTNPCLLLEAGVPVLPVVGLALTGASSATLTLLGELAWAGTAIVLLMATLGVAWLGWLVGHGLCAQGRVMPQK